MKLKPGFNYLDRAWQKGRKAYRAGKPKISNPYPRKVEDAHAAWLRGWNGAKLADDLTRNHDGSEKHPSLKV